MKLVICEKNIAARRIAQILSNGTAKNKRIGKVQLYEFKKDNETWNVIGLKGHIVNVDYPPGFNQWTKVSPRDLIDVEPCKKISEKAIALALKSLVKKNPFLIIATDFDREGELIGVEVVDLLKNYNKNLCKIKRAKFSAITKSEITKAFKELVDVDYNLSSAGEARQVIDLVWGAVLTRFISLTSNRLGKDFLSIGRVQSPTLALLVEREREIRNFKPKNFWRIVARLRNDKAFDAEQGIFWEEKQAKDIYARVKDSKEGEVKKVDKNIAKELPPPPFNTTTFLQSASSLGFSASKAMSIAEELYTSGYISYPRTDNTVYPYSLNIKGIVKKLSSRFSEEALEVIKNGREYPRRGKKETTDHPPIHPVDVPSKLNPEQEKIYELVCRRFLATLAKDAVSETTKVVIDINGEEFRASGYKLLEPNWRKIYTYIKEKRKPLPELKEGEKIKVSSINLKEDKTKPPKRYTQGSLISKMEQLSLGTKSTRHEIINKLYSRKYIIGSPPIPTSTAIAVIDALSDCDVIKPKMTSLLEEDMNAIAEGKKTLQETVKESREMLSKVMEVLEKDKEKIKESILNALKEQNTIGKCPDCGETLVIRYSKKGKRFVGCSGYPNCGNTYPLPQKGAIYKTSKKCDSCGTPIIKIRMKGKSWEFCPNSECANR
jgi:DNA topoisomerase-1